MEQSESIVAAVAAATGALTTTVHAAVWAISNPKQNILTLTPLAFEAMLYDAVYDEWFRQNLRCSQATFLRLRGVLRQELKDFELDQFMKEHAFEEKSWAIDVIGIFSRLYGGRCASLFIFRGILMNGPEFKVNSKRKVEFQECQAIMTPFMENDGAGLTRKQLRYNYLDSRTRVAVECAFGLWKGRFRIVNCCINTKCVKKAVGIVTATMVLHNILLGLKDDTSLEDEDDMRVSFKEEEDFV
ncbi:hypothetical protein PHPALM_3309 [Phytophthora palmivora]|uniref:DDE Tnp4 domain-containing protein n=1 Tax=Phytophthora palmivora TaxID=4796 RepID=A0A2P4YMP6_9STRA|nr:hypothetical protein PHPALM_3309 [Phytophthora palmivora]